MLAHLSHCLHPQRSKSFLDEELGAVVLPANSMQQAFSTVSHTNTSLPAGTQNISTLLHLSCKLHASQQITAIRAQEEGATQQTAPCSSVSPTLAAPPETQHQAPVGWNPGTGTLRTGKGHQELSHAFVYGSTLTPPHGFQCGDPDTQEVNTYSPHQCPKDNSTVSLLMTQEQPAELPRTRPPNSCLASPSTSHCFSCLINTFHEFTCQRPKRLYKKCTGQSIIQRPSEGSTVITAKTQFCFCMGQGPRWKHSKGKLEGV